MTAATNEAGGGGVTVPAKWPAAKVRYFSSGVVNIAAFLQRETNIFVCGNDAGAYASIKQYGMAAFKMALRGGGNRHGHQRGGRRKPYDGKIRRGDNNGMRAA